MTDKTPHPSKDAAPAIDTSLWSREKLTAAFLAYRNIYTDEAVARRKAVAEKIGLEAQLADSQRLLADAEQECEQLQSFITSREYGSAVLG